MNRQNVTEEKILHVANLAKISLTEYEIKEFMPQIENILEWVHQVENVNNKQQNNGDSPMEHCKALNAFSNDENSENNLDLNSPKLINNYFTVPKVIE